MKKQLQLLLLLAGASLLGRLALGQATPPAPPRPSLPPTPDGLVVVNADAAALARLVVGRDGPRISVVSGCRPPAGPRVA